MISAASVRALFDQSGIKSVVIIDDVFDPPGTNLSAAEAQNVFETIEALPGLLATLAAQGLGIAEPDDLNAARLAAIKKLARAGNADAVTVWASIADISTGKKVKLDKLADDLRRSMKVSVKKISAASARENATAVPDDSNVVFLDYELEAGKNGGDLSSSIVGKIYAQFKGKESAPLLILMSSIALKEGDIANFQKQSDFLSGMFYFVPKADLYELEKRHYRLAAFAKALPTGQVLQKFIEKLDTSLQSARSAVFSDLRSLNIADYAFLQTMRLHEDGQPMGEYLMWMISAHLLKELGGTPEMKTIERAVSKLTFDDLPPTNAKPSASLGALYSSAVMRPMDELPDPAVNPMDYLQFGDLFRKGVSKKVMVCITPPCDLSFGPTRPISSSRSVLFLNGSLLPIEKALKSFEQRQPRTELVSLGGSLSRIVWDTKTVTQLSWGDMRTKLEELKFKRVARLNTPFALEIQRSFATDLTRIGMPVPPPIYNPVSVEMSCLAPDGSTKILTTAETATAHLTGSDRGEKLVLGSEFMDGLPAMLAEAATSLEARHQALLQQVATLGPGLAASAKAALDKVQSARKDANTLSAVRGPFDLSVDGLPEAQLEGLIEIHQSAGLSTAKDWIPLRVRLIRSED